jgi:hypothetical protein
MPREIVKLVLLIMTNAASPRSARRALAAKLTSDTSRHRSREAARILARKTHPPPAVGPTDRPVVGPTDRFGWSIVVAVQILATFALRR